MLASWASLNSMPLSLGLSLARRGWCTGASERVATTTGFACGAGFGSGLSSDFNSDLGSVLTSDLDSRDAALPGAGSAAGAAATGHIGLGLNSIAVSRGPGSETLASAKVAGCAVVVAASCFQSPGKRNAITSAGEISRPSPGL